MVTELYFYSSFKYLAKNICRITEMLIVNEPLDVHDPSEHMIY